jgi:hypothetical protein
MITAIKQVRDRRTEEECEGRKKIRKERAVNMRWRSAEHRVRSALDVSADRLY